MHYDQTFKSKFGSGSVNAMRRVIAQVQNIYYWPTLPTIVADAAAALHLGAMAATVLDRPVLREVLVHGPADVVETGLVRRAKALQPQGPLQ